MGFILKAFLLLSPDLTVSIQRNLWGTCPNYCLSRFAWSIDRWSSCCNNFRMVMRKEDSSAVFLVFPSSMEWRYFFN
jgi:hypothetical protein